MAHGTHDFAEDARNDHILVWVNGELVPRERAVVSVFDAGFVLGDGVWEGLRVRAGHPAFVERHLDRLFEGAKAIVLDIGQTREQLTAAIYQTLEANEMADGVWAPYWYAAVEHSTGFEPWRPREIDLSEHDATVAEACRPIYDALYARRVRP